MAIKSSQTLVQEALKEIKTINTDEAYEMSQNNKCNLIDIRDIRELEKEGRISRQTKVNKFRKSRFKNAIKKMNVLIEKKNKKDALTYLPKLNSEIMKIAKTGIIKKRNASRNLSRITKKINSL